MTEKPLEPMELLDRQAKYDALVEHFGRPTDPSSPEAFALHQKVMRILEGQEPDPRQNFGTAGGFSQIP